MAVVKCSRCGQDFEYEMPPEFKTFDHIRPDLCINALKAEVERWKDQGKTACNLFDALKLMQADRNRYKDALEDLVKAIGSNHVTDIDPFVEQAKEVLRKGSGI